MAKLTCLWDDGVFLGVRGVSGEPIIGDSTGVWKTRSMQRKPIEDRWKKSSADMVVGVPWRVKEDDPNADGELPDAVKLSGPEIAVEREKADKSIPDRFTINREDLEKHGFSSGCPGCKAILKGTARQGHSEGCRKRLATEMRGEKKVLESQAKVDELVGKR